MIAQLFRSRSSWHSSLALAAYLFPRPATADDWPPPLHGPIEVADDSAGTPGETRWPQLTSLGGGELALTFVRGGVDLSLARTSDGLDWRVVNESVEDVPPEVLAINQSAAVDIGGRLGVAWRYYDRGVTRMRFSVLDLEGAPVGAGGVRRRWDRAARVLQVRGVSARRGGGWPFRSGLGRGAIVR